MFFCFLPFCDCHWQLLFHQDKHAFQSAIVAVSCACALRDKALCSIATLIFEGEASCHHHCFGSIAFFVNIEKGRPEDLLSALAIFDITLPATGWIQRCIRGAAGLSGVERLCGIGYNGSHEAEL